MSIQSNFWLWHTFGFALFITSVSKISPLGRAAAWLLPFASASLGELKAAEPCWALRNTNPTHIQKPTWLVGKSPKRAVYSWKNGWKIEYYLPATYGYPMHLTVQLIGLDTTGIPSGNQTRQWNIHHLEMVLISPYHHLSTWRISPSVLLSSHNNHPPFSAHRVT
jgi:hypothetical protein